MGFELKFECSLSPKLTHMNRIGFFTVAYDGVRFSANYNCTQNVSTHSELMQIQIKSTKCGKTRRLLQLQNAVASKVI